MERLLQRAESGTQVSNTTRTWERVRVLVGRVVESGLAGFETSSNGLGRGSWRHTTGKADVEPSSFLVVIGLP